MAKKQSESKNDLAIESYILIAATVSSLVFIWSVVRLAKTEITSSYRGYPNNYASIVAIILLLFAISRCKKKWERNLILICCTILLSGYLVFFFGLK